MTLTIGTGPFSSQPGGVFNFRIERPAHALYFEDYPRRVRAVFDGRAVADSRRVELLHETGLLPVYYFPRDDVRLDLLEPSDRTTHCPFKGDASYWSLRAGDRVAENVAWAYPDPIEGAPPLAGYLAFYWDAMDAWFEEDEEVLVHPPDPYHRIDVRDSSRHVKVSLGGDVLAETDRPKLLFETGLPTRYYIPEADVRTGLLTPTETTTRCPYKGLASYWSVKAEDQTGQDLVWSYPAPLPEAAKVAGHLCFWNERIDLEVDGEPQARPRTRWSP